MFNKPDFENGEIKSYQFNEYTNEQLSEYAMRFYKLRNKQDFTYRVWDEWTDKPLSSQAIKQRFNGFTRFKISSGIPTMSTIFGLTPEEVTNHLLNCIKHYKTYPSRKRLEEYNRIVGINVGHGYFEKYWGSISKQSARCKMYVDGLISYEELIEPTVKSSNKKRRIKHHSEDDAWDFAKKNIEYNGYNILNPNDFEEGQLYNQGAYGDVEFINYLEGKAPDYVIKLDNKSLLPIECKGKKEKLEAGVKQVTRDANRINKSKKYSCPFVIVIAGNNKNGFKVEIRELKKKKYSLMKTFELERKDNFPIPR